MQVRAVRQSISPGRLIQPFMWMLMAFYMGYHALHGERGLYALMREKHELEMLETAVKSTKSEREKMELHVSHLRSDSLDRDLLDEQMRRMLGVMKKDEVVILVDKSAK